MSFSNTIVYFPAEVVLSITTGKLLTEMGSIYEILNYMTGDNLFTHQLPRAARFCAPAILEQHPVLDTVDASEVTPENWQEWLEEIKKSLPASFPIAPTSGNWLRKDPVEEAVEMVGEDRVFICRLDPEQINRKSA